MTPEKRLYLQKVRALAERIAIRAGVTKPRVALFGGDDWIEDRAIVFRKVWTRARGIHVIASVRVDAELVDGRDEAYTLDELLPESEARFALVNLLMQRTPYVRPRLPR